MNQNVWEWEKLLEALRPRKLYRTAVEALRLRSLTLHETSEAYSSSRKFAPIAMWDSEFDVPTHCNISFIKSERRGNRKINKKDKENKGKQEENEDQDQAMQESERLPERYPERDFQRSGCFSDVFRYLQRGGSAERIEEISFAVRIIDSSDKKSKFPSSIQTENIEVTACSYIS